MRRIEAVIKPWTLDSFKEAALRLGISDFDVVEVHRSRSEAIDGRHLYRGLEYTPDLLPCLRLEFVAFDDTLQSLLHELFELVHPESIAVFKIDRIIRPAVTVNTPSRRRSEDSPLG